jgi:hypothetical protein
VDVHVLSIPSAYSVFGRISSSASPSSPHLLPELGLLSPPPSLSTILAPVPPTVEIKLFVPLARFTRRVEPRFTARCCLEQSVEHLKGTGQGQILGAPRSVHECPHGYLDIGVKPRPLTNSVVGLST